MKSYQYIIVGGGMTGSSAVMGIRKEDKTGTIAMFSKENYGPYNRPPLTKGLWDGKDIDDITRPMDQYDVDLFLRTEIKKIMPEEKTVITDKGEKFTYQKLLLATGGHPMHLPDSPDAVIYYRTRKDYHLLRELINDKEQFCVIGGGFIGSEIAAALNKQGKEVTMIFPEVGISGLRFPDELALFINDYYRQKGVMVKNGYLVQSIEKEDDRYRVEYKNKSDETVIEEKFDCVIVGIGIKPNVGLAEDAGIETEDGIVVNELLQTNFKDIFAAGDVSFFTNQGLGKRVRVEHEDNANEMGMRAGLNMAGKMEIYDHFPFFYSDMFDLGYEALGELNKDHEIFTDWIEPNKKGTVFYLDDGKIKGLIFWNLWGQVDKGREIIKEGKIYQNSELPGLFTED
jgi:NADPH-dependent 2,4-dienoyl-CoA reductase/sulfur reductase-like enzyme